MRWIAILGAAIVLSGCAGGADRSTGGGDACRSAGHRPGSDGYTACQMKREDDQARATRKIANDMPLRGYGPIGAGGRF